MQEEGIKMERDFVSVIILNYNGRKFLKDCLDTISNQSVDNYEIILVDNNSTDGSVEFVKANYPHVKVIECKENYGFAKGNNIGVTYAKGRYIILLNNDTKVKPNYVEALYKTIKQREDYGLVGTTTLIGDKGFTSRSTLNVIGYWIPKVFKKDIEIFGGPGYSLIFDRKKVPIPFDDDYFIYNEDVYLAWLIRLKGYNATHTLESPVWHYGSGTMGSRSKFMIFHGEKNRLMNLLIFYEGRTFIKLFPLFLLSMVFVPIRAFILYGSNCYLDAYVKAYWWVLRNFGIIMDKRKKIQTQRKVRDEEIFKYMSYKLSGDNIGKFINLFAKLYCKIVGVRTYDMQ